jgi:hypothetical protein
MSQGSRISMLCSLAAAAVVTIAAPAQALTTHTADFANNANGYQVALAECGKGEHVISGGYRTSDIGTFATTNRAKGRSAWRVRGSFTEDAEAYAYCSSKLAVEPVRESADTGSGSLGSGQVVEAECPGGTSVASGGFTLRPRGNNDPIFTSMPASERVWKVQGIGPGGSDYSLSAFAYCLDDRVEIEESELSDVAPDGPGQGSATATCADGAELLGGGFETQPEPDYYNQNGPDTFFDTSARDGSRAWTVEAINYSSFEDGTIQAFATCLK